MVSLSTAYVGSIYEKNRPQCPPPQSRASIFGKSGDGLPFNEFLSRLISLNLSRSGVEIPSFDDSVEHDVENDDGLQ